MRLIAAPPSQHDRRRFHGGVVEDADAEVEQHDERVALEQDLGAELLDVLVG